MPPKGNPIYARFRESHHALARMFAAGLTISKVSRETGYTRRRLHILLQDPTFQDLIIEKSKDIDEKYEEAADLYHDLSIGNMVMAEMEIKEHFEDAADVGERLPLKYLMAISKDRADRFGYGPRSVRYNVNADFAVRLDRAIDRTTKTIEAQPSIPPKTTHLVEQRVGPHQIEHSTNLPVGGAPAQPRNGFPKAAPSFLRRSIA